MGYVVSVTITDDLSDYSARQTIMSGELATSMEPGMLVAAVLGLLSQIADASPSLGGGPDLNGQRELEAPPPSAEEVEVVEEG